MKDKRLQCVNMIGGQAESGLFKSLLMRLFTGEPARLTPYQRAFLLKRGYTEAFLEQLEGLGMGAGQESCPLE